MAVLTEVLVVNAGSTSLKLTLVDEDDESRPVASLEDAPRVAAVGHRVVHGGERFTEPTLIDDAVAADLASLVELAPLHNAPALAAIAEARERLPDAPHVAVFDTAFHRTIPAVASTYALPRRYRNRGIRRFGFHGLSVAWAAEQEDVSALERDPAPEATLALDVYCYRIAQAVAAMAAALGGLDALVFTAGVGEHSARVRNQVCGRLTHLGVVLDEAANAALAGEAREDVVVARAVRGLLSI